MSKLDMIKSLLEFTDRPHPISMADYEDENEHERVRQQFYREKTTTRHYISCLRICMNQIRYQQMVTAIDKVYGNRLYRESGSDQYGFKLGYTENMNAYPAQRLKAIQAYCEYLITCYTTETILRATELLKQAETKRD